jgi:monoamine oxidase
VAARRTTSASSSSAPGWRATVIEGSTRIGGRCWSGRGLFDDGQIIEHGGELIDTGHAAIRRLARDLRLDLDDVLRAEPRGTEELFYFDGQPYTMADAIADFQAVYPALQADSTAAGYPTLYTSFTPAGQALDNLSVRDWINSRVPGGVASRLGQLLDVAYTIEYGAETTDQSSLNLIYLLSGSLATELAIFGASDERFKVRGGNDLIVQRLGEELDGQIRTGARLTKVKLNGDGSYTLSVTGVPGGRLDADHVVMAIPFSILRGIDTSQAGFSTVKNTAIQQLGMGSNAKLQLQFKKRSWYRAGCNGEVFSDTGLQTTWEATRAQDGEKGILVNYTGGATASALVGGDPLLKAAQFLAQLEPVLPGITAKWNGKATLDAWLANPWSLGAYSYWKVGQYTAFSGAEGERSGNCHFAGEHTSIDYQGYLNGAVDTGIAAAKEILADLRLPTAD